MMIFKRNYVVSVVRRDFLFFLVLRIGCVILLCHSLGLQYNNCDLAVNIECGYSLKPLL